MKKKIISYVDKVKADIEGSESKSIDFKVVHDTELLIG